MERSARVAVSSEVVPVFVTLIHCSSYDFALRSILETEYDVKESIHALKSEAKSVLIFVSKGETRLPCTYSRDRHKKIANV
jgi:hypothetical protein